MSLPEREGVMKLIRFEPRDCARIRVYLESFLNDELLVETTHDVLRHLEDCFDCVELLSERQRVKAVLQAAVRRDAVPADLLQRVRAKLHH